MQIATLLAVMQGATRVEVVDHDLLADPASALMISANNRLTARSGRAAAVGRQPWPGYTAECQRLSSAAGTAGVPQGSAAIVRGALDPGAPHHWIIHAITLAYDHHDRRVLATPEVVYGAVRAGLEKAELFQIEEVATYLMALRDGYQAASLDLIAQACCQGIVDHASIARAVRRIAICEPKEEHPYLARDTLERVAKQRGSG